MRLLRSKIISILFLSFHDDNFENIFRFIALKFDLKHKPFSKLMLIYYLIMENFTDISDLSDQNIWKSKDKKSTKFLETWINK